MPLLPAALMQTLTQALIGNWLFRMAPKFGLEYWDLVALLVVGGAVAFGSMPFTGRIADRGRARLAVTVGYALVALGLAGFAFMPPVWTLFLLAACTGLGYAFLTPGWAALVAQTLPEAQRPAAWGVLMTVENGGFAAGPLLGGLALQQAGVRGPFALGAVLALITSLGYVLFRRHFQSRPQESKRLSRREAPIRSASRVSARRGSQCFQNSAASLAGLVLVSVAAAEVLGRAAGWGPWAREAQWPPCRGDLR
ncbi:MFS transporter [Deinococcus malanensis]|uniref:MFS transporter n=1 Tax=Deinococcus malanensis TaxID=1706855 RepID=UPI003627A3A7